MSDPGRLHVRAHELSRGGAFLFAVLMLFVLTQGPVYTLWLRTTAPWDPFTDNAILASFMATYLVAGVLLGRAEWRVIARSKAFLLSSALILWVLLSSTWSVAPALTFSNAIGLVGILICALWFSHRFSPIQQAAAVFAAGSLGVVLSVLACRSGATWAFDEANRWVGIYINRNSLAPVAALVVLASIPLLEVTLGRRQVLPPGPRVVVVVVILTMDVFASICLAEAGSRTSLFALAVAVIVRLSVSIARRVSAKQSVRVAATAALSLVGLGVLWLAAEPLSRWTERTLNLSGRGDIWHAALAGYAHRPVLGWGFAAAWYDPSFRGNPDIAAELGANIYQAHNGYLELLLGAGPVAIALLLATTIVGGAAAVRCSLRGATRDAGWIIMSIVFVLVANMQESFTLGHHILPLLLIAGFLTAEVEARRNASDSQATPSARRTSQIPPR